MKKLFSLLLISMTVLMFSCKEKESERFELLTGTAWEAESLLAGGVDATGPGGLLEGFTGVARFKTDGTGTFGSFEGEWAFNSDETKITINAETLPLPIVCTIVELSSTTLKLQAQVPNPADIMGDPLTIEMTFSAQ